MWLIVIFFSFLTKEILALEECISKDYGNGGTVCVCNTTYCDKISKPEKVPSSQCLIYTSNLAGLRFQKTIATFQPTESSSVTIEIDSSKKYQTIFGWGGAFTDAAGINIKKLPNELQQTLLENYFSEEGIEYNIGRVPIGGTDFSTHGYSYDDGAPDQELRNFKLAPEDYEYKIPYINIAKDLTKGNLRLVGSAWTAPKWMKTNNKYSYSRQGFIKKNMYQCWANYHVRFLDEYQKFGIKFWGITTGNEPGQVLLPLINLETVGWHFWTQAKWIGDNLGPTVRGSSHSDIKILILDDQRPFLPWYVVLALRNQTVRNYVDGIAVHWYFDKSFPPKLLNSTHDFLPEKFILMTEACNGFQTKNKSVLLGSWARGENYSSNIIENLLNWVVGWVDWNLVLDEQGRPNHINNFVDSPIIINSTSGEFYKQPMFYHLGHFSKFVPRRSIRIESNICVVKNIAFQRPDNGTTVVLLNDSGETVPVNVNDKSRGTVKMVLSPRSITTIVYW